MTRCWERRWPMSADTLEMLFREFLPADDGGAVRRDVAERRDSELGVPQTLAAVVRGGGSGPSGAQTGAVVARVPAAQRQNPRQPGGGATAGEGAPTVADAAGRHVRGAGREPVGVRVARARQDALSVRPGPGVDPGAVVARSTSRRPSNWSSNFWRPRRTYAWTRCSRSSTASRR